MQQSNLMKALERAAKNENGTVKKKTKKTTTKPAKRRAPAKRSTKRVAPKKSVSSMIASLRARGYSVKKR